MGLFLPSLNLSPSLLAALVVAATLVVATLGDVLLARCSGSSLRVNLLPTHLVRELAAELRLRCNPVGSWRWPRSASRRLPRWAHVSAGLPCPSRSTECWDRRSGDRPTDERKPFQHVTLHSLHELRHVSLAIDGSTLLPSIASSSSSSNVSVPLGMGTA